MRYNSGLIPARFLILISHFVICVTLLWSSKESARFCLTERVPEYNIPSLHTQLVAGLSVAVALMCFELLAFLIGFTMFNDNSIMLSVITHALACVWLSYVVLDGWECEWFWWIFSIGSALPFLHDLVAVLGVLIQKKY